MKKGQWLQRYEERAVNGTLSFISSPPAEELPTLQKKLASVELILYPKEFIFDNRMFLLFSSPVVSTTGFQGSEMKWEQQSNINFWA